MHATRRGFVLSAAVLTLAACGGSKSSGSKDDDNAEPATSAASSESKTASGPMPQGDFTATGQTGAKYTVHVPADIPADITDYASKAGVSGLACVSVDTDNSSGSGTASPSDVILVGADGQQLDLQDASTVIQTWGPVMHDDGPKDQNNGYYYAMPDGRKISEDDYNTLNSTATDMVNKYQVQPTQPGSKSTKFFLAAGVIADELTSVTVQDAMQQYPATPAS